MRKVVLIVFLTLFFVGTLILTNQTKAIRALLTADCKVHEPWWTSQTRAWAKVTWGHPTAVGSGQKILHGHTVKFRLHARVGDQEPVILDDTDNFLSNVVHPRIRNRSSLGTPRWDGDA
ncbi:hypothetical protein C6500_01705 [Candidatus Poribacteria bacterium]|nr:MAG: hypothetical protein C6500_01705 [Candidatus Poribacteria bacterium]